jgi:hypothetical protein
MPLFLLSTMTKKSSWVGEAELKRKVMEERGLDITSSCISQAHC